MINHKITTISTFLLIAFKANAQISNFDYWEIRPSEPRIRWSPVHNPNLMADWQVRYTLTDDFLTIGSVKISPLSKVWAQAPKNGDCRILKSNVLFDATQIEMCNVNEQNRPKFKASLNGVAIALSGTILLANEIPMQGEFYFEKINKIIRVSIKKPAVNIVDISVENERWMAILQNQSQTFSDLKLFDYTFPYRERIFKAQIDTENSELILSGFLGIRYVILLEAPDANQRKFFSARPRIKTNRDLITYSDKLKIEVYVPDEDNNFKTETWELTNLEKNKWTEIVRDYGPSKVSLHALRMPNYEASTRLSVVRPADANVFLPNSEIAILGFHENFFSDQFEDSYTHRFGWRLRTFNSIGKLDPLYELKLNQGELRVLLNQAVWNIEETFGLLGSVYQFNYAYTSAVSPGIGFFWGRPMPNIFDRLIRWIPWFKYPKYTDLDFTYIPPHHQKAEANLVLNFHGKMFFPNNIFFEGGLSYYRFSTYHDNLKQTATLQAFVGTVGLGYMF